MAGSSKKIKMANDDLEEKENKHEYPSLKAPILQEIINNDPFLGSDHCKYMTKDRLGKGSLVKGPTIEKRVKLPRCVTQHNKQARLFTKAAGSTEGLIQSIGSPRWNVSVPLHPLHNYMVLHTRQDGWAVFYRQTDLSILVFNVVDPRPQNLLPTPPIADINQGKILSASLIGETSLGSLEVFLIGSEVAEGQPCGFLLHLGRNEPSWSITRFPSTLPTKAVGPLLLDGGILVAILNGSFLFTHNLHDLSAHTSILTGFDGMGACTLVKGTRGTVFAIQVPNFPYAAPTALEIGRGQGWLIPTITPLQELPAGRYYLTKNGVGFSLPGGSVYFTNFMGDRHLRCFLNGAWEDRLDAHADCICTGGFVE